MKPISGDDPRHNIISKKRGTSTPHSDLNKKIRSLMEQIKEAAKLEENHFSVKKRTYTHDNKESS